MSLFNENFFKHPLWLSFYKNVTLYLPKVLLAIITLWVGLKIVRFMEKVLDRAFEKNKVDPTLSHFLKSLLSILLKILIVISVASMIGIQTTSFIAVLGAAGFAIGLALQGSLSNFSGGVLILLFRPFEVGDFIEAQGYSGTVKSIQTFNTVITTGDNKKIIIPNGPLAGGNIVNYSSFPRRRVDMVFGVSYNDDLAKVKSVLKKIVDEDDRILTDPEPLIVVSSLGDSSVNFTVRVWCESANYWGIYFDMQEKVKLTFDKEGISIPYPHQEVILNQAS